MGRQGGPGRFPDRGAAGNRLTHETGAFINFRDYHFRDPGAHGYRWVDIKHFRIPPESGEARGEAHELLAALIGHEQFRDDYAGGGVQPEGTRHGPYWLRLVTPCAYEPLSRQESEHLLRGWADQFEDVPAELEAVLRQEVFGPLAAADHIYRLSDLGEDAQHDWGGVHGFFHEFVLIDRSAGRVTLLVAADD